MNDLTKIRDEEGRSLIFRAADLKARFMLLDLAEAQYAADNNEGFSILMHALDYIEDRMRYELWPPPSRKVIRMTEPFRKALSEATLPAPPTSK